MSRIVNVNLPKDIRAYFGTSGSGKSHQMKQAIQGHKRVMVFDPEGEYQAEGFTPFQSVVKFAQALEQHKTKNFRFALEANGPKVFDIYCRLAWYLRDARNPLTVVVDELAGVTGTSKADGAWHSILTRGRKYGLRVRAGAQSPTEIDKTLMRQRSYLWVGMMERGADFAYMANETGQPADLFANIRGRPHFESAIFKPGEAPEINKKKT